MEVCRRVVVFIALLMLATAVPQADAAETGAAKTKAAKTGAVKVYVKDMHCVNCAKKIARKLYVVPGVVSVKTYLKYDLAVVQPQASRGPSPRALWEAVEKAGFEPVKIEAAGAVFTDKPEN